MPIDQGDASGMNLLDLTTGDWSADLVRATSDKLETKLPRVVKCSTEIGTVDKYFQQRWNFREGCKVMAWSGDNPNAIVGMRASATGTAVISLGTSDTFFEAFDTLPDFKTAPPPPSSSIFFNPSGGYMSLTCYKNGSLARDEVRRKCNLGWDKFEQAILEATKPGNDGCKMLPYFVPEITPRILTPLVKSIGSPSFENGESPEQACRAVVEAQALAMRRYASSAPQRILTTGGASSNKGILQIFADVMQAPVVQMQNNINAPALGCAIRLAALPGLNALETAIDAHLATTSAPTTIAPNSGPAVKEAYAKMDEEILTILTPYIEKVME
jgi:xylulokinase